MTSPDDKNGTPPLQPSIPASARTSAVSAPVLRHPRALVPVLVSLGMLVAVVSSLGAPLIPTIAAEDHVAVSTAQWALTVTMLVGAIATPVMGVSATARTART